VWLVSDWGGSSQVGAEREWTTKIIFIPACLRPFAMACLQRVGASVMSAGNFLSYRASIGVLACGASLRAGLRVPTDECED
jgi:hypothetical protein